MKSAAVVLALATSWVTAAEFEHVEAWRDGDLYYVTAAAQLDAGTDAVRTVLTDYDHMHWITGAVLKAQTLERPAPGLATIFVRSRACFGIFCKTMEQVQSADARDPQRIVFTTLPGQGDLKQGHSEWRITSTGDGQTRIEWEMSMEPDFWVPFFIGSGLIRDGLADEGRDMIRGIEKLAREREQRK